jgi:hypothetical protein
VAIKLLAQALAASAEGRERFRLEARAAARVRHPNVVASREIDQHDRAPHRCWDRDGS